MVSENQGYMYVKFFIHDVYGSLSKKKNPLLSTWICRRFLKYATLIFIVHLLLGESLAIYLNNWKAFRKRMFLVKFGWNWLIVPEKRQKCEFFFTINNTNFDKRSLSRRTSSQVRKNLADTAEFDICNLSYLSLMLETSFCQTLLSELFKTSFTISLTFGPFPPFWGASSRTYLKV